MERQPRGLRVVIVEDHDDNREMLRVVLEFEGHRVEEASDGQSGAELIERLLPDVALVDLGLPGVDGYAVARRIREQKAFDAVGLVALSGWANEGDIERAYAAGFDEHLAKPASPETVLNAVSQVVARRGSAGQRG